jgi:hypothetical protein
MVEGSLNLQEKISHGKICMAGLLIETTFDRFPYYTCLKGLSHEIFGPVCWPVWIYLNKNRLWFLNFKEALKKLTVKKKIFKEAPSI